MSDVDQFQSEFRRRVETAVEAIGERDRHIRERFGQATSATIAILKAAQKVLEDSGLPGDRIEISDLIIDKSSNANQSVTITMGQRKALTLGFSLKSREDSLRVVGLDSTTIKYAVEAGDFGVGPRTEPMPANVAERQLLVDPSDGGALSRTVAGMLNRMAER